MNGEELKLGREVQKVKKKILVFGIFGMILVLLSGSLVVGCKSEEEKLIEELTKGELEVSVPKGYYTEPPQAKGKIRLGKAKVDEKVLKSIGAFGFEIEVKNISNQILEYAELAYTVYDGDGEVIGVRNRVDPATKIRNLQPGETKSLHSQSMITGVGVYMEVSKFEYTVQNIKWLGESALVPGEEEPISPPERTEEGIIYSASNYPKNPKTAEEVIVAFYFLLKEEKLDELSKCCGVEGLIEYGEITYVPSWSKQLEFLEINDVSEEKTIIRDAIFTSPTAVWLRGSTSKQELTPLIRKGPLFRDIEPYELDGVVYTREVIKGRYGEFASYLDEEQLEKIRIIRVTREYTKKDVRVTLYFKNGNEDSQTIEAIKVGEKWKVGYPD